MRLKKMELKRHFVEFRDTFTGNEKTKTLYGAVWGCWRSCLMGVAYIKAFQAAQVAGSSKIPPRLVFEFAHQTLFRSQLLSLRSLIGGANDRLVGARPTLSLRSILVALSEFSFTREELFLLTETPYDFEPLRAKYEESWREVLSGNDVEILGAGWHVSANLHAIFDHLIMLSPSRGFGAVDRKPADRIRKDSWELLISQMDDETNKLREFVSRNIAHIGVAGLAGRPDSTGLQTVDINFLTEETGKVIGAMDMLAELVTPGHGYGMNPQLTQYYQELSDYFGIDGIVLKAEMQKIEREMDTKLRGWRPTGWQSKRS
jgi:hypothetical protein